MVAKCGETNGSWPDVLFMSLFFLRMTPHSSSGFSLFLLAHGWEPSSSSWALYQAWVGKNLGSVDVEEWVTLNSERVQELRDAAMANYQVVSEGRKQKRDKTSQERKFVEGQSP